MTSLLLWSTGHLKTPIDKTCLVFNILSNFCRRRKRMLVWNDMTVTVFLGETSLNICT